MKPDDLCWTRDTMGIYYLARITGPWRYVATPEHRRVDVINIRSCEWLRVGPVDGVPGKVVSSFRPRSTVQAIADETVCVFSTAYYNANTASSFRYELPVAAPDVWSLMSSEDCEDIVALYMQLDGYVLLPSTCKSATVAYEWVMKHRSDGALAAAQVKSGRVDLIIQDYSDFPGQVYLFTSKGRYLGDEASNVRCLSPDDVLLFVSEHSSLLPERARLWLSIARELHPPLART